MSDDVAKKGKLVDKKFKKTPMEKRFPDNISPDAAIESILNEYGRRHGDGLKSETLGQDFAEIISWRYGKNLPQEQLPSEKVDQLRMNI